MVEGCKAGNRKAQEWLYRSFYDTAMRVAMRYSRDEQDAADIMSSAFVKLFRSISAFDATKGNFEAWLRRIVVNEGLDHIKGRSRFGSEVALDVLEVVEPPQIDNGAIARMEATAIMQLIQKLPPATHAVFVLYAVEGYNHREIAERLGISEGTSKWHLSEARKTLQQQILQAGIKT
jgi:RNA polymerase sigma factor (sigma-70 family)